MADSLLSTSVVPVSTPTNQPTGLISYLFYNAPTGGGVNEATQFIMCS